MTDRHRLSVPVVHGNSAEHRRLLAQAVNDAVSKSNPETITGAKTFDATTTVGTDTTARELQINGPAGQFRLFSWLTGGVARFQAFLTNDAEGGSNTGSNWVLSRLSDAGASLGRVIDVRRSDGATKIGNPTGGFVGAHIWNFNATPRVNNVPVVLESNFGQWTSFTPTVTLTGTGTVPQYTTNDGRHCRVGNLEFVDVRLVGDGGDEGAGTGEITIALPVAVSNNVGAVYIVPNGLAQNGSSTFILAVRIQAGQSTVRLRYWSAVTTFSNFTGAQQDNTSRSIFLSFFYEVD